MRAKTKELKEMQGTYEPSKEAETVELTVWNASRLPAANKEWPPKIQALWNRRCKDLQTAGYLAEAYLTGLRLYCFAVMMAEQAQKELISGGFVTPETGDKGQTYEVVSKWLTVLEKAQKTIDTYEKKFGLTPLDASKIPAVKKQVNNEESLLE